MFGWQDWQTAQATLGDFQTVKSSTVFLRLRRKLEKQEQYLRRRKNTGSVRVIKNRYFADFKMNIFVINLKEKTQRRESMREQLEKIGLSYQFIDAVNGKELSDFVLESLVYDYPDCYLTKGEIGCALSHLTIYKKMVKENIEHALILEDDVIVPKNILNCIQNIKILDHKNKPNVYLISKVNSYIENVKIAHNIYKVDDAYCCHAYILNKKAARELSKIQKKIKYESDQWGLLMLLYNVNVYCIVPHMIDSIDIDKNDSSLEKERSKNLIKRRKYLKNLYKKSKFYKFKRLKYLFIRMFLKIKKT